MKTKSLVLLSGGQDSTTCLYWAKHQLKVDEVHALTVLYGQRHASELEAARLIAIEAGCTTHASVVLSPLFVGSESALVDHSKELRGDGGMADREMPNGLPTSFVPGRNLLFVAAAIARAGAIGASSIVTGVCQTDYSGYPDCRAEFIQAMQRAVDAAWPSGVDAPAIYTPLMHLSKSETVALANGLPGCMEALSKSITCYHGKHPGCMTCPACVLRQKGFNDAGVADPAVLASS